MVKSLNKKMGLYDGLLKGVHKQTDKHRSLSCFCCLSMLISLVLGYRKCKTCSRGIYSEGRILRIKIKLRNAWAYTLEGGALFLGFCGIL